jgi:ABC-type transport system substrate-binding protein
MAHQFESLVSRGRNGIIEPLGARSWSFSKDHRTLRFIIDTSRRFSDGSGLSAEDFKKSWEDGLKLQAKSNNSALADALFDIKGFSRLRETGTLEGVRTTGKDILELEFEKPVRSALEHLAGTRYAAYKVEQGHYIGTGPYVITENNQTLTLTPNAYSVYGKPGLENVRIAVIPPEMSLEKISSGEIDAMLFAEYSVISKDAAKAKNVKTVLSQEGSHVEIMINGAKGRFFAEPHRRRAFQALTWQYFKTHPDEWPARYQNNGFFPDTQSFLEFQAGRLPSGEAETIVSEGLKYIGQLAKDSQKQPLLLCSGTDMPWLTEVLRKNGIKLSAKSRTDLPLKELLAMFYKTLHADILPITISIADADPDGLYHLLGKNGAIFSPMAERKEVAAMLEKGREIIDTEKLAPHYQCIGREILKEVPYVHLGYWYRSMAYNSKVLRIKANAIDKTRQSLTVFEPES